MTEGNTKKQGLLIFDYDGTLNVTLKLYKSAVLYAMNWLEKDMKIALPYIPDDEKISKWIGVNADDMWNEFMPELPVDIRDEAIRQVGFAEERFIPTESVWFSGVEQMLTEFKEQGIRMVVLSNCLVRYAKANWDNFHMERWFQAFLACESYDNIPKEEIVRRLIEDPESILGNAAVKGEGIEELKEFLNNSDHGPDDNIRNAIIFIGDRGSDHKAASCNGLNFIGCGYGYGSDEELKGAFRIVTEPMQIVEAVDALIG